MMKGKSFAASPGPFPMLWFTLLSRAAMAPFRFWRASLATGVPMAVFSFAVTLSIVRITRSNTLVWIEAIGLLSLWFVTCSVLSIAWFRQMDEDRPMPLRHLFVGQPRERFLLQSIAVVAGSVGFVVVVHWAWLSIFPDAIEVWNSLVDALGNGALPLEIFLFGVSAPLPVLFGTALTVLGNGLPALAIGKPASLSEPLRFALSTLHHIAMAWIAFAVICWFGLSGVDTLQRLLHATGRGPFTLVQLGFTAWIMLTGLALVEGVNRVRTRSQKTEAPQA